MLPQTNHVDSTLKEHGNCRFDIVSTGNLRGVYVGVTPSCKFVRKGPSVTKLRLDYILNLFLKLDSQHESNFLPI